MGVGSDIVDTFKFYWHISKKLSNRLYPQIFMAQGFGDWLTVYFIVPHEAQRKNDESSRTQAWYKLLTLIAISDQKISDDNNQILAGILVSFKYGSKPSNGPKPWFKQLEDLLLLVGARFGALVYAFTSFFYKVPLWFYRNWEDDTLPNIHKKPVFWLLSVILCLPICVVGWVIFLLVGLCSQFFFFIFDLLRVLVNFLIKLVAQLFINHQIITWFLASVVWIVCLHNIQPIESLLHIVSVAKLHWLFHSLLLFAVLNLTWCWCRAFDVKQENQAGGSNDRGSHYMYHFIVHYAPNILLLTFFSIICLPQYQAIFIWNQSVPFLVPLAILLLCGIVASVYRFWPNISNFFRKEGSGQDKTSAEVIRLEDSCAIASQILEEAKSRENSEAGMGTKSDTITPEKNNPIASKKPEKANGKVGMGTKSDVVGSELKEEGDDIQYNPNPMNADT